MRSILQKIVIELHKSALKSDGESPANQTNRTIAAN